MDDTNFYDAPILPELERLLDAVVAAHDDVRIATEAYADGDHDYTASVVQNAKAKYDAARASVSMFCIRNAIVSATAAAKHALNRPT